MSPAVSPIPAHQNPPNPDTDSGVEENPITEPQISGNESEIEENSIREQVLRDSESENQGVEEVGSSSSSQEEVTVDPSNIGTTETVTNAQNPHEEEGEHNNNKEKPKIFLELPTNRLASANTANRQLILHQVPVSFPIASNLMESMGSLIFIQDALLSITAPGDLPGDVVTDATPLNRVESHQNRTAIILTLDSEQRRDEILRKARKRYADKRQKVRILLYRKTQAIPHPKPIILR